MKKEILINKTIKLIQESNSKMLENLTKLVNNGSIDYENADDNYVLPKMILCALLKEEYWQYKPDNKKDEKLITNIFNKI